MPTCAICENPRKRKGITCMECDTFFCLKCVEEFNLGDDEELDDCWVKCQSIGVFVSLSF